MNCKTNPPAATLFPMLLFIFFYFFLLFSFSPRLHGKPPLPSTHHRPCSPPSSILASSSAVPATPPVWMPQAPVSAAPSPTPNGTTTPDDSSYVDSLPPSVLHSVTSWITIPHCLFCQCLFPKWSCLHVCNWLLYP